MFSPRGENGQTVCDAILPRFSVFSFHWVRGAVGRVCVWNVCAVWKLAHGLDPSLDFTVVAYSSMRRNPICGKIPEGLAVCMVMSGCT